MNHRLRCTAVLHGEHHGVQRREGGPRDPILRRSVRAGTFARSMGRADALKPRRHSVLVANINSLSGWGQSRGAMRMTFQPIDELCINTIRTLSIDAVQKANSGHPGMPLGAAPMAYVLWTRHLRHNPTNPKWPDRDRFVLSAGHASMLLYSLLFLTGYDLTMP